MTGSPDLYKVCEATWPPARMWKEDGWIKRDGAGGGKRVSATSLASDASDLKAITDPLYLVRDGEGLLDKTLEKNGYHIVDPVNMYVCPIELLTDQPIPKVTAFSIWEPLAIMEEIWALGGIGPARLDVMHRAKTRTGIFSRWNEKPAGVAFAAIHNGICMVHAVEVLAHQRRQGVAAWMMRKAAFWAAENGADQLSVLCTRANVPANGLYSSLGMTVQARYHYRQKECSDD
ncbi:MAG: GNAT family N-acetyltransferase [Pseudomonadota bacterium]